jgi:hypothetical protein
MGLQQWKEMVEPRVVEKEDDQPLMEQNKAFAQTLRAKIQPIKESKIIELVPIIDHLNFQNAAPGSILLDPELPYVVMAALKRGCLHPEHGPRQVATLLSFWGALQYHKSSTELQIIDLFDAQGNYNPNDPCWRLCYRRNKI